AQFGEIGHKNSSFGEEELATLKRVDHIRALNRGQARKPAAVEPECIWRICGKEMMRPPVGRIRVYVLLVDGARCPIVADLRDGLHQVSIDQGIFRWLSNGTHRILTLPYFFQLAKHHLAQQNDA